MKSLILAIAILSAGCAREYKTAGQIAALTYAGIPEFTANQNLTSSGSSQQTTAFSADTIVRVQCINAVYFDIGTNPTATSADPIMGGTAFPQYYYINGTYKIAVIQVSSGGVCSFTPMEKI